MPSRFTFLRRQAALGALVACTVAACATPEDQGAGAAQSSVGALRGDTTDADTRTPVEVSAATRAVVLREMRTMLRAVQGTVAAAANHDTAAIRSSAATAGLVAATENDPTVQQELGSDFVMLGMRTHASFDSLAMEGPNASSPDVVLRRMAGIMGNCVGCHEQYRLIVRR